MILNKANIGTIEVQKEYFVLQLMTVNVMHTEHQTKG